MKLCKFLEDYLFFTQGNETPEIMHLWVGISVLAGAAEKRVWIDRGFFRNYLNLYIVLLGPPGVCSKSTSLELGGKMLKETGYSVLEGSVLKEKIILEMVQQRRDFQVDDNTTFPHCSITFLSDELKTLLTSGSEMGTFLVDIWGRDDLYVYKTKNSGQTEIPYPYFNLLTAAVPQWFGSSLASDMGATGLLARCILVYQDKKRGKFPEPIVTPEQWEARNRCINHLLAMQSHFGPIPMTTEANDYYKTWYMSQEPSPTEDFRIVAYLERRTKTFVLKVAALMALGDGRFLIDKIDIERSLHVFNLTEKRIRTAYLIAGGNRLAPHVQRIKDIIKMNGGRMEVTKLYSIFHTELEPNDFKTVLQILKETNDIELRSESSKTFIYLKTKED